MDKKPDHQTSIVSIVGKNNSNLHFLANLHHPPFDPESVLTVIGSLKHKPEVKWHTIHSIEGWCTSMDQSTGGSLFVATMEGELHKYDGNQWSILNLNCANGLNSVWAANNSEVFIAGLGGERIHVINERVELTKDPHNICLNGIHGSTRDNVVAVGDAGVAFKFDGKAWSKIEFPTNANLLAAYCLSESEILIGGAEVLYRWDGAAWHYIESKGLIISSIAYYQNDIYAACGSKGVYKFHDNELRLFKSIAVYRLKNIDSLLFAIGNRLVAQFNGQGWWGGELDL